MYAIFEVSGMQFTAREGDVLTVPHQKAAPGEKLDYDKVLLVKKDDQSIVGTPTVADAKIEAEIVEHGKGDKVLIYKYKRRTKYRRTQGHRQDFTQIKVNKIIAP